MRREIHGLGARVSCNPLKFHSVESGFETTMVGIMKGNMNNNSKPRKRRIEEHGFCCPCSTINYLCSTPHEDSKNSFLLLELGDFFIDW